MGSPTKRAFTREYYRDWRQAAWRRALHLEGRFGLVITAVFALGFAVAERVVGVTGSLGGYLLAVVGGSAGIFFILYLLAWWTTPAHLAWEEELRREHEGKDDWESEWRIEAPSEARSKAGEMTIKTIPKDAPWVLSFPTRNERNRVIVLGGVGHVPLRALRIIDPVDVTVRKEDLPYRVRLPWGGQLFIKIFSTKPRPAILLEEKRTSGRMIRAELYFEEES